MPAHRAPLALGHALAALALAGAPTAAAAQRDAAARTPSLAEPGISPDRAEIAFVAGGDIWTVPAGGGEARLLVSHSANESRPLYSPDGQRLAFISTRAGNPDIYVLTLASGEVKRLTFDDAADQLDGWSRDGRWIYFSSGARDIAGMNDVYRVGVDGGTPMPVSADRYAAEFWAAPAPDGAGIAFTARGISATQWWRKGSSHIDESEIWLVRPGESDRARYERVTEGGAREGWPMWSADGRTIYYVSNRGGAANLWAKPLGGAARQITRFSGGRVLWPSISGDGGAIVFERDFRIWMLDPARGEAREVPITLRGASTGPVVERTVFTDRIQDLALAPDGKKVAFVVHGEVFAAASKDGGDAARVTATPAAESQLEWAPDSRRLVYVSDRDGPQHLYLYDFASGTETRLTDTPQSDVTPRFSPDGKLIAFVRHGRELRVIDPATRRERLLATGVLDRAPFLSPRGFAWSPDSRWVAYLDAVGRNFTNVFIVPAAGGDRRQASWLSNVFGGSVSWSPDGSYLLLDSRQRTETGQLVRIDLVPRTPRFREDQFRDLFRQETPPSTPRQPEQRQQRQQPARDTTAAVAGDTAGAARRRGAQTVEIVFEDLRRRLSILPVGVDVTYQEISPDGKSVLMIAGAAGQQNLYVYSLDELSREPAVARQLTSTSGFKSNAQFSRDGKEVYYLEQGRIHFVTLETRTPRAVAVSAEIEVDFAREKEEVFHQAWTYLRDNFYDDQFHGVDWEAVRRDYAPRIAGARTPDEMRRVLSLMVGELNASHTGIGAPAGAPPSTGRLGLRFDPTEYERAGRLRISEVIPLGPAAIAGVKVGDYLLAVGGAGIDARTNLDSLLNYTINRRVSLSVAPSAGGTRREVAVRPVNLATERALLYRAWVEERRTYVAKASSGRLGYVHMPDMGAAALAQLYVDLDAENHAREGVVIDIRNNNGGFVNAYALDVFSRRPYITMTPRGALAAPMRTQLGQRSLELPTILVVNQHSLSDAEDFTEGYRALGLGKVVGEPTAGWIIYTSNVGLIDGTTVRIPATKITTAGGENMELRPRPVDVHVQRPMGESYTGRDSQLDAAVRELLAQIDASGRRRAAGQ